MRTRALAAVAALVGVLTMPAGASPTSSIDRVSASLSGNTLTAEGAATFSEAVPVWTDAAGDARRAGIGSDVTSATIGRVAAEDALAFTLAIADPLPEVFTVPELVHYHWYIAVTNGTRTQHYLLQAMRTGQQGRTVPNVNTLIRVVACVQQQTGSVLCDGTIRHVPGTMADGKVEWRVPVGVIGAYPGAVVAEGPNGVLVQPGASGFAYVSGDNTTLDTLKTGTYVVGPSVALSVRRAGTTGVTPTYAASLGPDGSFVGKLPAPRASGDYILSARACWGDAVACGVQDIPLQMP
jgi:hypothetical protein